MTFLVILKILQDAAIYPEEEPGSKAKALLSLHLWSNDVPLK